MTGTTLASLLDAQALNAEQARLVFDPSPEVDSLAERIVALAEYGVPPHVVRQLLADCRSLLDANREERHLEQQVAGALDRMLVASRPGPARSAMSVKRLARELRPLLKACAHAGHPCEQLVAALDEHRTMLALPSLHHELGGRLTRVLLDTTAVTA